MKYAFVNGTILDGTKDMKPVRGMVVLVNDGTIVDLVQQDGADLTGYEVVDLAGGYLLPGLINLHVHLAASGKPPKPNEKPKDYKKLFNVLTKSRIAMAIFQRQGDQSARTALMSGVTTLRTVGGILDFDGKTRDKVMAGKLDGPRILSANTAVSVPGGHFAGSLATEARTPAEAAANVRQIAATKPDLIKLMITGGVMDASEEGEPGVLRMPPDFVKAACDEAHLLGYKVAAHVESPEGVRVALENGVDTIEHGAKPDEEILKLFKERGAADICTSSPALPYAEFALSESNSPEIGKINGKIVMDGVIDCAKACLANDIPVGLGSDVGCPFITNYNFWRELYYFQKYCGVSSAFALYSATLGNAQIAGIDNITGSIKPGKSADLIVMDGNPLEDLTVLRNVRLVMLRGKLYKDLKYKKMPAVDALLDKYM
ncbi:MAG: amidohydrolase family protein [Mogibacterium sp.]|nr:amidohydrolase family protein [Mogibacterium sp.]